MQAELSAKLSSIQDRSLQRFPKQVLVRLRHACAEVIKHAVRITTEGQVLARRCALVCSAAFASPCGCKRPCAAAVGRFAGDKATYRKHGGHIPAYYTCLHTCLRTCLRFANVQVARSANQHKPAGHDTRDLVEAKQRLDLRTTQRAHPTTHAPQHKAEDGAAKPRMGATHRQRERILESSGAAQLSTPTTSNCVLVKQPSYPRP